MLMKESNTAKLQMQDTIKHDRNKFLLSVLWFRFQITIKLIQSSKLPKQRYYINYELFNLSNLQKQIKRAGEQEIKSK